MADEQEGEAAPEVTSAPEVKETPAPEPTPTPETPKPATAAEIAGAVAAALQPRGMTAEQQEEQWQRLEADTGFTRQQLVAQDNMRRDANLRDNLPLYEQVGSARAEKVLSGSPELIAKVAEEMRRHPANVRANPQAWEDAAFLIKGKFGGTMKQGAKEGSEAPGKVLGGKETRGGLTEGTRGAAPKKAAAKREYSEFEQRIIDSTCGGDAAKYEEYRGKDSTRPRAVPAEGSNRADLEMQRLTRGARV